MKAFSDLCWSLGVLGLAIIISTTALANLKPKTAFVGDSLAVGYGMAASPSMEAINLARNSTGLINKRLRDWPKYMRGYCEKARPQTIVVSVGANDIQPIGRHQVGSYEWDQAYESLMVEFIDSMTECNAQIVLVEPPPFADKREAQLKAVRKVINRFCVDGILCVKSTELLTNSDGEFIKSKNIDGKSVKLRADDGVHMTWKGYTYMSQEIEKTIKNQGGLNESEANKR